MWFGHRHRGHPEDTGGGLSERGEDFYPAIREDIQLATREDFFMAMDRYRPRWVIAPDVFIPKHETPFTLAGEANQP